MIKNTLLRIASWIRRLIRKEFHAENENLPYFITIAVAAVLFVVTLNGFVELTDELAAHELGVFDASVTSYVTSYRSETLTKFFTFVTHLGDRNAYVFITIALAAYFLIRHRSWKFILQTTVVLILATASNIVLKKVINRARPSAEHLVHVDTLSYPSGHAMSAMAFYGFLIFLCLRHKMPVWLRTTFMTLLVLLILSVGVSRIYLGVHYPSDVVGGFIGGMIWVTFCAVVFSVFELLRSRNADQ